ncbi:protein PAT1 homolog 2-like [Leucoraja erinacea]|uniref:protein PAT1 homolog 2-like n=1 Tax=Leucoraja erinaceus TaxID=7782 RepID=UPI0024581C2A|nr:protein PAT1 homolog 2-like [Leucoraja erinacea]
MTDKEKAWIIKLQMIQLQSENPRLDDYYYQEYFRKLERKLSEMELGEKWTREPQKLVTPYVQKAEMYDSVVHIKGSLGQVAVSTCYSPRRAIDVVHLSAPEEVGIRGFFRILRVRKGVQLLARLLPMFQPPHCADVLVSIASFLRSSAEDSLDEFTISYLYALLSHGGTLLSLVCPARDDVKKWTDLVFVVARELSLIPESELAEPLELPSNLLPLFCRHLQPQMAHRLQGKILSRVSVPSPPADP